MAEIINLREFRRKRERARARTEAAANRMRSGRTKAEKKNDSAEQQRLPRELDNKKLDRDED